MDSINDYVWPDDVDLPRPPKFIEKIGDTDESELIDRLTEHFRGLVNSDVHFNQDTGLPADDIGRVEASDLSIGIQMGAQMMAGVALGALSAMLADRTDSAEVMATSNIISHFRSMRGEPVAATNSGVVVKGPLTEVELQTVCAVSLREAATAIPELEKHMSQALHGLVCGGEAEMEERRKVLDSAVHRISAREIKDQVAEFFRGMMGVEVEVEVADAGGNMAGLIGNGPDGGSIEPTGGRRLTPEQIKSLFDA